MEIKPERQPAMVKQYWPRYHRNSVIITILMQFVLALAIGSALVVMGGFSPTGSEFWIMVVAIVAASVGVNIVLVTQLLTPLRDLSAALTHVSGEPTDVMPPNPNARHFERDGFKPLLQLIYQSAVDAPDADSPKSSTSQKTSIIANAFEQTTAGVIIMNSGGEVLYANRNAPIARDSDSKKHLQLLFERDGEFNEWLADCRESSVHAEKSWLRVPDKIISEESRRIFDITATYEKGNAAEVVLVCFDRSQLYQPEDDDLDFISFAAHELRGPITVIRGYLDVLGGEIGADLQPDQQELIKRLVVSANRLSSYINNILNASRFDRRHMQIHLNEENIAAIYDTINDDMQLRAQSQNRLLTVQFPPDLPTIAADRSSISEVLGNLIDNALKYSNEGGAVYVTATLDGNFVKVSVQDQGIGMPASVIGNLFHKFYRSHRSRETVAGTGIGLYVCKAIVESHGGQIGVVSTEGQGSLFTFTIPTYASVADKLQANDRTNAGLISHGGGWIKNHSMYKG